MKSMGILLAATVKQFMRDKTAVFFTFAFPLIFILLFGMVFGGNRELHFDIGVADEDQSDISRKIVEGYRQVPIFTIKEGTLDDSLAAFKAGRLRAVVLIPKHTQLALLSGASIAMKVYNDPSHLQTTHVVLPVLRQVVNEMNRVATQSPVLVELKEESILSVKHRFIDFLVPGILAMSIMHSGLFGIIPLVLWREKKVLKRFGVTPVSRGTVVVSQLIFRLVLAVAQAAVLLGVARLAFGVKVHGSWLAMFGFVTLGTLAFICLGYVVAARVKTVEGATPVVSLISFPMMFLSGVFWPVEMMPDYIRPVVTALPLTYLIDGFRQVMVQSAPLYSMTTDAIVLGAWMLVCMVISIRLFRFE